jgi:hypothetical protein
VVVHNLYGSGVAIAPDKAQTPLIVDPDAVLPLSVASQQFKPVAWGYTQKVEAGGGMQLLQFAQGSRFHVHQSFHALALEQGLRVATAKIEDHG